MLAEMGVRVWLPSSTAPPVAPVPARITAPVHSPDAPDRSDSLIVTGRRARWLVIGTPADLPDPSSHPDANLLLDRMLKAVGLTRDGQPDARAHVTALPSGQPISSLIAEVRPAVILIIGRQMAAMLLGAHESLGQLRGRCHEFEGVPALVTYPPTYLIRQPEKKGNAWADLCLAASAIDMLGT